MILFKTVKRHIPRLHSHLNPWRSVYDVTASHPSTPCLVQEHRLAQSGQSRSQVWVCQLDSWRWRKRDAWHLPAPDKSTATRFQDSACVLTSQQYRMSSIPGSTNTSCSHNRFIISRDTLTLSPSQRGEALMQWLKLHAWTVEDHRFKPRFDIIVYWKDWVLLAQFRLYVHRWPKTPIEFIHSLIPSEYLWKI